MKNWFDNLSKDQHKMNIFNILMWLFLFISWIGIGLLLFWLWIISFVLWIGAICFSSFYMGKVSMRNKTELCLIPTDEMVMLMYRPYIPSSDEYMEAVFGSKDDKDNKDDIDKMFEEMGKK